MVVIAATIYGKIFRSVLGVIDNVMFINIPASYS